MTLELNYKETTYEKLVRNGSPSNKTNTSSLHSEHLGLALGKACEESPNREILRLADAEACQASG